MHKSIGCVTYVCADVVNVSVIYIYIIHVCVCFISAHVCTSNIYIYIYIHMYVHIFIYTHTRAYNYKYKNIHIIYVCKLYIYMYKNDMHICLASSSWPCYSFPRLRSKDSQTPLGCCLPLDPSVACAQKCGTYFFDLRRVCSAQSFVFCFAALGLLKTPCKAWRSL